MGGRPKGLLEHEGSTLLTRLARSFESVGIETVLVGRRSEYLSSALETIDDEPPGIGPLGGVCALLRRAGDGVAVVVACDMPFLTSELLARLLDAADAPARAPRIAGEWEPMLARYNAPLALPVAARRAREGKTSLQGLLDELRAEPFALAPGEERALTDWDTPEEMNR